MAKLFNLEYAVNDWSQDKKQVEVVATTYLKAYEASVALVKKRTSTGRILNLSEVRDNLIVAK